MGGFNWLGTCQAEWPRGLYEVRVPGSCPEGKSSQDRGWASCRVNWEGAQQPGPLRTPARRPVSVSAVLQMAPRSKVRMVMRGLEFTWWDPGVPRDLHGIPTARGVKSGCLVQENQGGNQDCQPLARFQTYYCVAVVGPTSTQPPPGPC